MHSITLRQGTNALILHGLGVTAPGRAAVLRPAYGEGESLTQEIDLSLEGSAAEIETRLVELGRWLAEAAKEADRPGGKFVYLECVVLEGGQTWRSRVLGGYASILGGGSAQRGEGSQGVRLTLERVNYWEGARTALPLQNQNGYQVTTPLQVSNHDDWEHGNFVRVYAELVAGELPAPVELWFRSADVDGTGMLIAGGFAQDGQNELVMHELDASTALPAGVTGTKTLAADASGGYLWRVSWAGESEVTVFQSGVMTAGWFTALAGRAWLPVVRVNAQIASDKIFLKWRLQVQHNTLLNVAAETPGVFFPNARNLCACAPMFVPPWPLGAGDPLPSLAMELRASAAGAGAHTMDLDFVQLMPLESWRIYRPVISTAGPGLQVKDDPLEDRLLGLDQAIQYHTAEGPGLWVKPNTENMFAFLWEKATGGWLAHATATVQMFYRPRKRVL